MLERLTISGLRGIASGELTDLAPITVLVGPNGSGKSTLLQALLIGTHPLPAEAVGRAVAASRGLRDGARWLLRHADERSRATLVAEWPGPSRREVALSVAPSSHVGQRRELEALGGQAPFTTLGVEVTHPDPAFPGLAKLHVTFDYEGRYAWERFEAPAPTSYVRLHDARQPFDPLALSRAIDSAGNVGAVQQANALLGKLLPEYSDLRVGVDAANQPYPKLQGANGAVPLQVAGDGIQSAVRFALSLAGAGGGLVLLEEPEVHLHRGGVAAVATVIVNAVATGAHVVISTHSLELIDALVDAIETDEPRATRAVGLDDLCVLRTNLQTGVLGIVRMEGAEVRRDRRVLDEDLR